jgi:hypothetical protein
VIRQHDFNSRWWGEPVGIVDQGVFFSLPPAERARALAPFRWVEFKSRFSDAPPLTVLRDAGFFLADTQVEFRIGLKATVVSACAENLAVHFANEAPFDFRAEDVPLFEHERYQHLPGNDPQRTNRRYVEWARQLIGEHPDCCLQVSTGDAAQGWFLSRPAAGGLNLTLAMLRCEARISGFLLYDLALRAYAARGHRIGWAGFSVTNTAVLNIYAKLGAHFTGTVGIWLWAGA